MSPNPWVRARRPAGFPRVSGDEPVYGAGEPVTDEFSPRERG